MTYFKFHITDEVKTEMQDLLITQGIWVNSTLPTHMVGGEVVATGSCNFPKILYLTRTFKAIDICPPLSCWTGSLHVTHTGRYSAPT